MLRLMKMRLDVRGMLAATLLVSTLSGCAEARPAEFPKPPQGESSVAAAALSGDSASELHEVETDEVALGSASAELEGEDVAIDSSPYEESFDDYDLAADQDPATLADFQTALAPYGAWAEDATYGTVWIPDAAVVGDDFAPYVTAGHWALTEDDEWLWVSDYDWGWAPFHYGRWVWISGRGWAWIPGRVYAPAWVVWRTGYYDGDYVGWAPMPPTWYWRSGVAVSLWVVPPAPYVFCSTHYVFAPHVHTHIVPASRVSVIARHTRRYYAATPTGGRGYSSYVRGPSPRDARIPASAAPRAKHNPRALAYASPAPGGRLGARATPRAAGAPLPRSSSGRPFTSSPARPSPALPRPAPHGASPSPRAPAQLPSRTPAPRVQPGLRTAPAPRVTPTPRVAPVAPSPRVSPKPMPRPSPSPRSSVRSVQPSPRANVQALPRGGRR